jgi:hypothetical protein
MTKDLGGMSALAAALGPEDFKQSWAKAKELGWSYNWSRSIVDQFVHAVIAWSGCGRWRFSAPVPIGTPCRTTEIRFQAQRSSTTAQAS